jgi:hypothetical protein
MGQGAAIVGDGQEAEAFEFLERRDDAGVADGAARVEELAEAVEFLDIWSALNVIV